MGQKSLADIKEGAGENSLGSPDLDNRSVKACVT